MRKVLGERTGGRLEGREDGEAARVGVLGVLVRVVVAAHEVQRRRVALVPGVCGRRVVRAPAHRLR